MKVKNIQNKSFVDPVVDSVLYDLRTRIAIASAMFVIFSSCCYNKDILENFLM